MHDHLVAEAGDWITCPSGERVVQVQHRMDVENDGKAWTLRDVGDALWSAPESVRSRMAWGEFPAMCIHCREPFFKTGMFFHAIHVGGRGWMPLRASDKTGRAPA